MAALDLLLRDTVVQGPSSSWCDVGATLSEWGGDEEDASVIRVTLGGALERSPRPLPRPRPPVPQPTSIIVLITKAYTDVYVG